jgi:endonuclease YncB( thermonuclease family)
MMEDAELINASAKTPKFTLKGNRLRAKCVKVYDGDTGHFVFRLRADQPLYRYNCRFLGYDTAEMKDASVEKRDTAKKAKEALAGRILDKIVELEFYDTDKYGRQLVICYENGANVNKWMCDEGHGREYFGKGEKPW